MIHLADEKTIGFVRQGRAEDRAKSERLGERALYFLEFARAHLLLILRNRNVCLATRGWRTVWTAGKRIASDGR